MITMKDGLTYYNADDYANQPYMKWWIRYMELAKHVAMWSKDPSTKVGAVIVSPENRVVGTGYNGFPAGVADTDERLNDRPTKYALVQHAERNAIHSAMDGGHSVRDAAIFVWPTLMIPNACNECMKSIVTVGICDLFGYYREDLEDTIWTEQSKASLILAHEGGCRVHVLQAPYWETYTWKTATFHPMTHPYSKPTWQTSNNVIQTQ